MTWLIQIERQYKIIIKDNISSPNPINRKIRIRSNFLFTRESFISFKQSS